MLVELACVFGFCMFDCADLTVDFSAWYHRQSHTILRLSWLEKASEWSLHACCYKCEKYEMRIEEYQKLGRPARGFLEQAIFTTLLLEF